MSPPHEAGRLQRVRAFIACRPCVAGWVLYLAAAVLIVAFYGSR